ncbi:MAG: hypothetical protein ACRBCI_02100 [Cellvibrionaceae bacterium]
MVSKAKLYKQLDSLESELEESLKPLLEKAANGQNDLVFCVSDFNPFKELKSHTNTEMEELIKMGAQILVLKEKLEEDATGSIAERICWYCREWGNIQNHHRANTQELAKQFLTEIDNSS